VAAVEEILDTAPGMRSISVALFLLPLFGSTVRAAEARAPSVVVMPFEEAPSGEGRFGYAAALTVLGALEAENYFTILHLKQLNRASEFHQRELKTLDPSERKRRLAQWLGADFVVSGRVTSTGDRTSVEVELIDRAKAEPQAAQVAGKDLITALAELPKTAMGMLGKAGAYEGAPKEARADLTRPPRTPVTTNPGALLEYAACYQVLIRQPIGVRDPVVLDPAIIEEAVKHCEAAKKLDPGLLDARAALGLAYALKGDQPGAERELAGVKNAPVFLPAYWIAKFWLLSRYYDNRLAVDTLRQTIAEHPGFLLARGYLGDAYNALGRYQEGLEVYQAYLDAIPDQPFVMSRIGYSLARLGRFDEAIDWNERALKITPGDSEISLELAGRYLDAGRLKDAQALLKQIVSEGNARGEVYLRLGYGELLLGDEAASEKAILKAIKVADTPAEWRTRGRARYDLAKLEVRHGDTNAAVEELMLAISEGYLDPMAIERDPDVKQLAAHPRLKKFLAKWIGKVAGLPQYVIPFPISKTGEVLLAPNASEDDRNAFLSKEQRDALRKLVRDSFDANNGCLNHREQTLWPAVTELALLESVRGVPGSASMAQRALLKNLALIDRVWGGAFDASAADAKTPWKSPRYSRTALVQAEEMRLYAIAWGLWGASAYRGATSSIDAFVMGFLRTPDETCRAGQAAFEGPEADEYYRRPDADRRRMGMPKVDPRVVARDQARLAMALALLYEVSEDEALLARAVRMLTWTRDHRKAEGRGYFPSDEDREPHLEDTTAMVEASLALAASTGDPRWLAEAKSAASAMEKLLDADRNAGQLAAQVARAANELALRANDAAAKALALKAMKLASVSMPSEPESAARLLLADRELGKDSLSSLIYGSRRSAVAGLVGTTQRF
jgi:tetratricopeptide (TPR) repeat protein